MKQAEKIIHLEAAIEDYYRKKQIAPSLVEAILYSICAGGKRLRPLLLLDLLEAFGVKLSPAHFQVAGALEMIHTGSLIHDDLPAMDDDDYRRGSLTNHKKFGEAMAILAGDALFLDPYGLLAKADLPDSIKITLISNLSDAAGTKGMVAGQVLDLEGEKRSVTVKELQTIHANKTGKLLTFPFFAAGIIAQVPTHVQERLQKAGNTLGLAFQVRDDILDVSASFQELGKTPKKDLLAEKSTYPALLGLKEAILYCNELLDQVEDLLLKISREVSFSAETIQVWIEGLRIHD